MCKSSGRLVVRVADYLATWRFRFRFNAEPDQIFSHLFSQINKLVPNWSQKLTSLFQIKQFAKQKDIALSCSQIDLVQIISYGQGELMEAKALTTSNEHGILLGANQTPFGSSMLQKIADTYENRLAQGSTVPTENPMKT